MINFFIESPKKPVEPESKLTKYLAAGSAALASVGFTSYKVADSLRKYDYLKRLIENKEFLKDSMINSHYKNRFYRNISQGVGIKAYNTIASSGGKEVGVALQNLRVDRLGRSIYDLNYDVDAKIKAATQAFYDGNLEQSAEILQQNGVTVGKSFGFIDEIAHDFNAKMTSFKWFNVMKEKLGSIFGEKHASFSAYAVIGVILIILIVCLYWLFRFLYRKYKAARMKGRFNKS